MEPNSQSGQVVIELIVISLLFVGLFLAAVSAGESAEHTQAHYRFSGQGNKR